MAGRATIGAVVAESTSHYPTELERAVRLRDGTELRLRPIRPDDAPRLVELYDRLGRHTAYQRFFALMRRLPPNWARVLASVDYRRRLALVVEHGTELVAVARYEPTDEPDTVEVAFVVQDGFQGQGLGVILLHALLESAQARGIQRFRAFVLADNGRMLDLLARFTHVLERSFQAGVVNILFEPAPRPTSPSAPAS